MIPPVFYKNPVFYQLVPFDNFWTPSKLKLSTSRTMSSGISRIRMRNYNLIVSQLRKDSQNMNQIIMFWLNMVNKTMLSKVSKWDSSVSLRRQVRRVSDISSGWCWCLCQVVMVSCRYWEHGCAYNSVIKIWLKFLKNTCEVVYLLVTLQALLASQHLYWKWTSSNIFFKDFI